MTFFALTAASLVAVAPVAPTSSRGVFTRVAVPDPQLQGDVSTKAAAAFSQALSAELAKLQGLRVISASDLRDLLGLERQKQLLGCGDENSCLAEMAGALDADEMLTVRVVAAGQRTTVTVSRLSVRTSAVLQSATQAAERGGGAELLALVGPMVASVYPGVPLRDGRVRGVDTATLRRLIPPPLPQWVFLAAAGATALTAGGAAVAGIQLQGNVSEFNRLAAESATTPVEGETLKMLEARARTNADLANGLLIGAGVLGAATVVVAFLTDWNGPQAVALVPTRGGAAAVFSTTW